MLTPRSTHNAGLDQFDDFDELITDLGAKPAPAPVIAKPRAPQQEIDVRIRYLQNDELALYLALPSHKQEAFLANPQGAMEAYLRHLQAKAVDAPIGQ